MMRQGAASGREALPPGRGFSLLELVIAVAIGLIITLLAIPLMLNVSAYLRLRGAVSSVNGAIQSTRYQAVFQGVPYQVVFLAAANTYQVQNQPASPGPFVNVCPGGLAACPVPLSGTGTPVTLNQDTTFTFRPGGAVQSPQAAAGITTLILTMGARTATIKVSSYGNTNVTYTP